ncbi:mCG146152, partial [Mus musculus]
IWSRTDLDLVNVSAGSLPVRIPTQEPTENLCPPWLLGGIQRCWGRLGLDCGADMPGNIETIASGDTVLLKGPVWRKKELHQPRKWSRVSYQ